MAANTSQYGANPQTGRWHRIEVPLASNAVIKAGNKVYQTAGAYTCTGDAGAGKICLGTCLRDVDQTGTDVNCPIDLGRGVDIEWVDNGAGADAVAMSTHFQCIVYWKNDHTVTGVAAAGGYPGAVAGILWGVDSGRGLVAIERRSLHLDYAGSGPSATTYGVP
jgi:hypothetical protein